MRIMGVPPIGVVTRGGVIVFGSPDCG